MSDNFNTERPGDNKETVIKKTGAYSETVRVDEDNISDVDSSSIGSDEHGAAMGVAVESSTSLDPDSINEQTGNEGQSSRYKARLAGFFAGLKKGVLKVEFKGEVSINDVKVSKEPFEERTKQSEKQAEEVNKIVENNANKNAVVRRILAKYEEKIENNPELASRLDSKAEVIAKVGHVPASQMSHVDKLVEKAKEVQGKGPFDF